MTMASIYFKSVQRVQGARSMALDTLLAHVKLIILSALGLAVLYTLADAPYVAVLAIDILFCTHLASQFGLDPQRLLRSLRGLPFTCETGSHSARATHGNMQLMQCLHDRYEEGGATKSEYFWQDLLVARAIHAAKPVRHVDTGSRVDGFVAHVASFRDCEVFDVRPISTAVPGVVFRQADLRGTQPHCQSLRGAIVIRSRACMPSNTLGWGVMATRSIRLVISAASSTWRSCCSRGARFIFPRPLVKSGWNLTPTGCLTHAASCAAVRPPA